jgi:hypothetical protein
MGSEKFKLDLGDVVGLVQTAVLVGLSAAVAYAVDNLGSLDLGVWTAMIVPVVAVGLQGLQKWIKDNTK